MPKYNIKKSSVLVVGIVKNIERNIESDIKTLEIALQGFERVSWFLVESNSTDRSISCLSTIANSKKNFKFTSLNKIQKPGSPRTIGMAAARNRYLDEIRLKSEYSKIKWVVVADFNGLNKLVSRSAVESCFQKNNWDACFANQVGPYYDIWALRHPVWSPNDCWQQHKFYRKYYKLPENALRASIKSRMIRIPASSSWIPVESAFGGFAIYKKEALIAADYAGMILGDPICEHVPLNLSLSAQGFKLFINPGLINFKTTDHSRRMNLINTIWRMSKYPYKLIKSLLK